MHRGEIIMAKPLTKILYIKLLQDVNNFINNYCQITHNKTFLKMFSELDEIVVDCQQVLTSTSEWKFLAVKLLEKLNQIYQTIPHDRWFLAYGSGIGLRDGLEQIFQNRLGIKPAIGYFSSNLMPIRDMDIAVGIYVGNPFLKVQKIEEVNMAS